MKALILIKLASLESRNAYHQLRQLKGVTDSYMIYGRYDAVLILDGKHLEEIHDTILAEIQPVPGVIEILPCIIVDHHTPSIHSLQDLEEARTEAVTEETAESQQYPFELRVSLGSCGIAAGASETLEAIQQFIHANDWKGVQTKIVGCIGMCALEPIVQVVERNQPPVTYGKVSPVVVKRIFREHIEKHHLLQEYIVENI
jgi:NADP-reducing hydrogenase subunit HndB